MIKSLEGARGVAAVLVALYHFHIVAKYFVPVEYGYLFVDLFFVLSGFVITSAYSSRLNSIADLKPFMIRRFGRLFPLMAFSTILFVLANNIVIFAKRAVVGMGHTGLFKNPDALTYMIPTAKEVIGTTLFTQGMGGFNSLILNYASWSISVEFYTYVLFAVGCLMVCGKNRMLVWSLLSAAGISITIWASFAIHDCVRESACYDITYDFGYARCVGGFFLGALVFHLNRRAVFNIRALQVSAVSGLLVFFSLIHAYPLLAMGFPLLCALFVLAICGDIGFLADVLQRKWPQVLGQRSFSIYMLHPVVLAFLAPVETVLARVSSPLLAAGLTTVAVSIYLAILVIVSGWTYSRIESPFRDKFNRYAKKKEFAIDAVQRS